MPGLWMETPYSIHTSTWIKTSPIAQRKRDQLHPLQSYKVGFLKTLLNHQNPLDLGGFSHHLLKSYNNKKIVSHGVVHIIECVARSDLSKQLLPRLFSLISLDLYLRSLFKLYLQIFFIFYIERGAQFNLFFNDSLNI